MKRIWGRVLSVCATALAVSAVVPACAENDQSIFIRAVLAPSTNRTNGTCVYTDDPQQTQLFEGSLDVGVRDNYFAVVLVGNQMIPRGDPANTRAESNRVHLNGAVVRVTEPDGAVISEFTSLASGMADPQANNNPDYGLMGVSAIDAPTRDRIAAQLPNRFATKLVVVNMKAFGKTVGGVDVESGEYQFTIRACNGCLVSFVNGDDPAQQPRPNCKNPLTAGGGGTTQVPCFVGQDEAVPCQLCQGRPACDPAAP
jgi:hypothetical protein